MMIIIIIIIIINSEMKANESVTECVSDCEYNDQKLTMRHLAVHVVVSCRQVALIRSCE